MVDPLTTSIVGWGFSAAGWLISPILTRFLNKCFDALGIDLPPYLLFRKHALFEKLENLQTILLPQLLILTEAAQQSPHRPLLKQWLQKLRYAFYEAEHVLGLVEYKRLEKEVNSFFPLETKFSAKKVKIKLFKFCSEKKKLVKSLENIEKIVNEATDKLVGLLNLSSNSINNSTHRPNVQYRETTSTSGSMVIGRDKDRDEIVKLLRENLLESSSNANCYSVIGIWGMGGSGKTTLAQYVCEYEKEANYFDLVIWAHVSQTFNVHAILKKISESAYMEPCPDFSSLEVLQSKVEEKLRGQRYFMVLDDAWCDKTVSEQEVDQLFAPLKAGKRGSKILVTSRIEEAAIILRAKNPVPLRELDKEQFLSLFMCKALGDTQIRNNHLEKRLLSIGEQIVAKLCRSPLAATTVAGQLRRRVPEPDFWLSILNTGLLNDTMGALYLSYQYLPPPLQRCFQFCSIFYKGQKFGHDHLVNLWIAEGFIEAEVSNEHMKDIANRYILELISSSFFQVDERQGNKYFMHDLMHDLAELVSEGECFRIENGNEKEIPTQTRHVSVLPNMLEEYMERICKLKYLCTIMVQPQLRFTGTKERVNLNALFMKSRQLRVVHIDGCLVEKNLESVLKLRNLRYLSVQFTIHGNSKSYNSLNQLYQLCVLDTGRQHISNVGRLISLHKLKEFHIERASGFEIKQLKHLTNLYGSLSIYGLHNVESKEEANQAKLSAKDLHKLKLYWGYESKDVLRDIDVETLEGLCPPPQIKELSIHGYTGKRFPSWISENNENIIHLKHLELSDCRGLEALKRINELCNLQYLTISNLPRLNSWEPLPLSVTKLKLDCLPIAFARKKDIEMLTSTRISRISDIVNFLDNTFGDNAYAAMEFNFDWVEEMMELSDNEQMVSTISKDIEKCLVKKLDNLIFQFTNTYDEQFFLPALEKLSIRSCFITDKILARSLKGLTSLTHVTLEDIITITCIPKEVLSLLNNIMVLEVYRCLLLKSIGGWDTHRSLQKFTIDFCPSLILQTSIDTKNCNNLELTSSLCILKEVMLDGCMPSDDILQGLISLKTLFVWNCPTIVDLHIGHLKSLVCLFVRDCPNIVSLRGCSELENLYSLDVTGCQKLECYSDTDKLPQLYKLYISRFSLVAQLISISGFSSLVILRFYKVQLEYFSPEECEVLHYLSSLEELNFLDCKLRSLPPLLCLLSLKKLSIRGCVNLIVLAELPPSTQTISILECNEEFTRSCKDTSHPNWHKISHIPKKNIER
ncbi:Disease resistance protein RGA2 [Rhynchospora pubera]|uniref:Disease resistance protein RGA2 n=1 Tax=Rhynchospora pubera TaxID=906938 RepID=A0AAV8GE98_9POAL|nr:Disease resistance protein RGA2 [Rhynchospora pubera]KAJ4801213.1 Disease resistance protein RGA2 [Rhynchospora pubera]